MDAELWTRAVETFEAASGLEGEERAGYLDDVCGDDTELREVVDRMLAADTPTEELMERREEWVDLLGGAGGAVPERLGPYRILREIGRGGMGAVYLAERADGRFERAVAVKIVRGGFDSERVRERFESEARILATLEHPNVARLYDAGVHEGRPYLVMEYVEGQRIDRYCDARRLGVRRRLELFRQICEAVQFAHRNLVVHRDLKPSNILVAADGSVRLLDFGIARLTERDGPGAGRTATGFRPFTPEYASPEQLRGRELTTGSDVYSLGVVLYELLTGRRPFETAPGDLTALGERATREPTSPSAVVTRPHESRSRDGTAETVEPDTLGAARGTTPGRLRRLLRGDLDRITLKALRADPVERYASVEALSEDVRRFLVGLPVSARRDSVAYRVARFVRRHRAGVAVAVLVFVALATAAVTATRQARIARQERDSAARAFAFLEELITSPDPLREPGVAADSVRMVDFIDRAAESIDADLTDEPVARARMLGLLGRVYINLGRGEQAVRVLDEAVAAGREVFGPSSELAEILGRAGFARDQFGDRAEGEALIREALDMMLAAEGEGTLRTAEWQEFLGRSLLDSRRLDEAEPYLRASLETRRSILGPDSLEVANGLILLSSLHSYRGEDEQALDLAEEVLETYERAGAGESPDYAIAEANLAFLYGRVGRWEDADRAAAHALGRMEATLGASHLLTASTRARLAGIRGRLGRPAEADSLYGEAIATLEENAPGNVNLPIFLGNWATFLRGEGRLGEAEAAARRGVATSGRILGQGHPVHSGALLRLGRILRDRGLVREAVELHTRARDIYVEALGPTHPESHEAAVALGRSWMAAGRVDDAERLLVATFEEAATARGAGDRMGRLAAEALVELYEAEGRTAEAERYRSAADRGPGRGGSGEGAGADPGSAAAERRPSVPLTRP